MATKILVGAAEAKKSFLTEPETISHHAFFLLEVQRFIQTNKIMHRIILIFRKGDAKASTALYSKDVATL